MTHYSGRCLLTVTICKICNGRYFQCLISKPSAEKRHNPSGHPPRLSWAEVVRKPATTALPDSLQARLKVSRQALKALASPSAKPIIKTAHFGGVPRGPIGALCRALLLSPPKWAVVRISFIGITALEVLCHSQIVERLIATMKLVSFRHLEKYDPLVAPRVLAQPKLPPVRIPTGGPATADGPGVLLAPALLRLRLGINLRPGLLRQTTPH